MKELSIEEKAKAYDEALRKARNIVNSINVGLIGKNSFEAVFPELRESEDERIRKELINEINRLWENNYSPWPSSFEKKNKYITWLEKQGEKESDPRYKYLEKLLAADDIYQMAMNDGMVEEAKTKATYALSKLEIGKLLGFEKKQGEQKPVVTPEFRIGDIITPKGKKEYYTIIDIVDGWYEFREKHVNGGIPIYYQFGWELVEQKPADNVEPKFKVGDWVVDKNGIVNQILSYKDGVYKRTNGYSSKMFEDEWRIWDITKDAKDGDVLSWDCTRYIIIFKELKDNKIIAHCSYNNHSEHFGTKGNYDTMFNSDFKFIPVTEEQRDLLFQKMREAGYEWNSERKELKKIEQKPWSEEDEEILDGIIVDVEVLKEQDRTKGGKAEYQKEIDWLKSLKNRYTWKPSEEQMNALSVAVKHGQTDDLDALKKLLEQLKKLREDS